MDILKKILNRIGHLLLSIVRVLRKAICCRRRKDDHLLPMTINQITEIDSSKGNASYEVQSNWDAWPEMDNNSSANTLANKGNDQNYDEENDYFRDMVPQIRKPKKLYIKNYEEEPGEYVSNRLAMDPKAILSGSELGVIDDNPSNWEDIDDSSENWNPDQLIRESKRAEREKRLIEHQRRKQERENRRASRQDSSGHITVAHSFVPQQM